MTGVQTCALPILGPIRENKLLPKVQIIASANSHLYCHIYCPSLRIVRLEYRFFSVFISILLMRLKRGVYTSSCAHTNQYLEVYFQTYTPCVHYKGMCQPPCHSPSHGTMLYVHTYTAAWLIARWNQKCRSSIICKINLVSCPHLGSADLTVDITTFH